MREVVPGLWRSPLPKARDVAAWAAMGGRSVVDLTQRPRPTVERACARAGLSYIKHPMPYSGGDYTAATNVVLAAPRPALFHCYHGRDRTGVVARLVRMREAGRVVLVGVGRNLNRAYRTAEAYGIRQIGLVRCNATISGRLFAAAGRVDVQALDEIPTGTGVVALETGAGVSIDVLDWSEVDTVLIGGETSGLTRTLPVRYAHIPMAGSISGLTVEGALVAALEAWRRP